MPLSTIIENEPQIDVLAAAVAGAAATMLTLLTVLGSTNSLFTTGVLMKGLFEAQLLVLETALILGITALMEKHGRSKKKMLAKTSAWMMIGGTLLLWLSATTIIVFA